VNFNFKILNVTHVDFLQNGFIFVSCISKKSFIYFGGDLEVVLVKKRGCKITSYYSREITDMVDGRVK
jgi:hypothetical protein